MAGLHNEYGSLDDTMVEPLFELDDFFGERLLNVTSDSTPEPSPTMLFQPCREMERFPYSGTASLDCTNGTASEEVISYDTLSQEPKAAIESVQQFQVQHPSDVVQPHQDVAFDLEQNQRKINELLNERMRLIQRSQYSQSVKHGGKQGNQDLRIFLDSAILATEQDKAVDRTSQGKVSTFAGLTQNDVQHLNSCDIGLFETTITTILDPAYPSVDGLPNMTRPYRSDFEISGLSYITTTEPDTALDPTFLVAGNQLNEAFVDHSPSSFANLPNTDGGPIQLDNGPLDLNDTVLLDQSYSKTDIQHNVTLINSSSSSLTQLSNDTTTWPWRQGRPYYLGTSTPPALPRTALAFTPSYSVITPDRPFPNTPQSIASLKSPYLDPLGPAQEKLTATRKRGRQCGADRKKQIPNIRQLSKHTGAPESFFDTLCFNEGPAPKRKCTKAQREHKSHVKKAGGSCFLCFFRKLKCSGNRPCTNCMIQRDKHAYSSTNFMWTCDVRGKLADIDLFSNTPLFKGISRCEATRALNSKFPDCNNPIWRFSYMFSLMDVLESWKCKNITDKGMNDPLDTMRIFSYTHSIVRRKDLLFRLASELKQVFVLFETIFVGACELVFANSDRLYMLPRKEDAIMYSRFMLNEMQWLAETLSLPPAVADYIRLVIRSRLKLFYAQGTESDPSKVTRSDVGLNAVVDYVKRFSSLSLKEKRDYISPTAHLPQEKDLVFLGIDRTLSGSRVDERSCLLSRCNIDIECHPKILEPSTSETDTSETGSLQADSAATNHCCCAWIFDSIPPYILDFFGHSAHSFALLLHVEDRTVTLGEGNLEAIKLSARVFTSYEFGPRSMDNAVLRKRKVIFRQALLKAFRRSFFCMDMRHQERGTPSGEQLKMEAKGHRQALLLLILYATARYYQEFWEHKGKEMAKADGIRKLIDQFSCWIREDSGFQITRWLFNGLQLLGLL
ncbi:hypothetical protein K505DRAFT_371945 [Melanomma pulvis-pyrius CBS 109.77]|uniref:Zn(2)-C6 fungal-type domain-containing protein n=1 Tax=Melanomma pulvis-pyrius CBS 109.77 TaxID=1314802 RepID=A0A6A6XRG9_9PLEO|nr:hypothetical protein K505DRAFT_371945 [Melanomma pulvis-pyrius CBS 109.77]